MRSRDGNSYSSFAVCLLIFFNSSVLFAEEYLLSYRYVVKNSILFNESLQISHAMKPCDGFYTDFLELSTSNENTFKQIVQTNSEEFISFLHKLGLNIEHKSLTINNQHSSTTIHTLKTTCFKVDFNDNFVKIFPLK